MKVVAFMQNMWVREPARIQELIERHGEGYRRRVIRYALFAGCLSGRRLKAAFGNDMCKLIEWDEASRVITSKANAAPPADPNHMAAVLDFHKPDAVLCFGAVASEAIRTLFTGKIITAPHPAARQADVPARLVAAAAELRLFEASLNKSVVS